MIYFLLDDESESPKVKIGYSSRTVEDRLKEIQPMCSAKLKVLGVINEGYRPDEQWLHALFDQHRLHGEWFEYIPCQEVIAQLLNGETSLKALKQNHRKTRTPTQQKHVDEKRFQRRSPKYERLYKAILRKHKNDARKTANHTSVC